MVSAQSRRYRQFLGRLRAARAQAGLTQEQLADLIGTTQSAISRLEDSDYAGHSLGVLQRVGEALELELDVRFVGRKAAQAGMK